MKRVIERIVIITAAAIVILLFLKHFWLKNRNETEDGGEITPTVTETAAPTPYVINERNTPAPTVEVTPTKAPVDTPTPSTVPIDEPTPIPVPTDEPKMPWNIPTHAPVLPTPTPLSETPDDDYKPDDTLLNLDKQFQSDGYENLYGYGEFLLRKTETSLDIENAVTRKRTEYLIYGLPYSDPAVVYIEEAYGLTEDDVIEKKVSYKRNANDVSEEPTIAFYAVKNDKGEWEYAKLLPDGTTVADFESEYISLVESGQVPLESAVAGIVRFDNKRIKGEMVDDRFGFTLTLSYEDYVYGIQVPDPYRKFDIKIWFLDEPSYEFGIDERDNQTDTAILLTEIIDEIHY